jgi:hypothetical protein
MPSSSDNSRANLKREASFAIEIIIILILDGFVVLTILIVTYLLDKAIGAMGLADGLLLHQILQYSHVLYMIIYLFFSFIHISIFLKDRIKPK